GTGLADLQDAIGIRLRSLLVELEILVPFARGDIVSAAYEDGDVIDVRHEPEGTWLRLRTSTAAAGRFRRWAVDPAAEDARPSVHGRASDDGSAAGDSPVSDAGPEGWGPPVAP